MRQFFEVKARYPHALLFYRMGDFYELFFDDAVDASKILDIALTKRGKHAGDDIPMCGVPVHAADQYLQKLIASGRIVAICEQLESPVEAKKRGAKSVVKRDVVRLVTPSTITEEALLEPTQSNFMLAITREEKGRVGCAWAEMSTAEFSVSECSEAELAGLLARIEPKEILLMDDEGAKSWIARFTALAPTWLTKQAFDATRAERAIKTQWHLGTLDGLPSYSIPMKRAIGAVLHYIELTQLSANAQLRIPSLSDATSFVRMDSATRRSLELTQTQFGAKQGSFLWAIDKTNTAMGGRALLARLQAPPRDASLLGQWHDQVALLLEAPSLQQALRKELAEVTDLERAISRLSLGRGGPRDLLAIRQVLSVNNNINHILYKESSINALAYKSIYERWMDGLAGHATLMQLLQDALKADVPLMARDGNFIAAGYRPDLDEYRRLRDESRRVILAMEAELKASTGINALKIKHNNVLGYFIEITPTHESKVPTDFIRRQGLANALRYTTVALSETARKIDEAAEKALQLELGLFEDLAATVLSHAPALLITAKTLAEIDVASSFAELAQKGSYVRPELSPSGEFSVHGGRHPVVEAVLSRQGQEFIANDCHLSADTPMWLITGPNMGGKSTFLRQNALMILLAHVGSYVPASRAIVPMVDQLFSRVGASDDLARGQSTFMVEMAETAAILNQATSQSFVILDEIGRGTATFDGMAIASAVTRYLLEQIRPLTLFATHYHELTSMSQHYTGLRNYKAEAQEYKGNLIFMHKISSGTADRSYGIQVAALAGMPKEVLKFAKEKLHEYQTVSKSVSNAADAPLFAFIGQQKPNVSHESNVLREQLEALNLEGLSPKEALDLLYQWKSEL